MQGEPSVSPQVVLDLPGTKTGRVGTPADISGWQRLALGATPLRLAAGQTIAAAVLVAFTLAAPDPRPGFLGLVGDTNDFRAYYRLATWTTGLGWLGRVVADLNLSPSLYLWTLRGAFVALALTNFVALVACLYQVGAGGQARAWRWLVGPVFSCLVLLAYPPVCSDVYYYAMSGHVANLGGNPYQFPLQVFVHDPLLSYQDWASITSPYGPLWTTISRGVVAITGPNPVTAVLGFKILAAGCALGLAGVTYLLAARLTNDRRLRLGALVLVAWQPVLLVESAGSAHNDAPMILLALGGLLVLTTPRRGAVRAGLLLITASVLIKYVTLPLLACAVLWRLRALAAGASWREVIRQWLLDAAAAVALAAAVFAPYWAGPATLRSLLEQSDRLVTNPIWLLPSWGFADAYTAVIDGQLGSVGNAIATAAPFVILVLIGLLVATTLRRLWRAMRATRPAVPIPSRWSPGLAAQLDAWAIATIALAFVPLNTHSWYAIWAIGPVALVWVCRSQTASAVVATEAGALAPDHGKDRLLRLPRWLVFFLAFLLVNILFYHTRVIS